MQALVLERKGEFSLRDIDLPSTVGPADVKVAVQTIGVCGSDVHTIPTAGLGLTWSASRWCSPMRPRVTGARAWRKGFHGSTSVA